MTLESIAIIGFGEVGSILARDLRAAGVGRIAAFDIAFADPESRQSRAAREQGAAVRASAAEATGQADLVVSSVTAGAALDAARAAADCGTARSSSTSTRSRRVPSEKRRPRSRRPGGAMWRPR